MTNEVLEIWSRVRDWPEGMQLSLAAKIIDSLAEKARPKRKTLGDLVGLLATNQPPPTDEEVERILDEERMRKYG